MKAPQNGAYQFAIGTAITIATTASTTDAIDESFYIVSGDHKKGFNGLPVSRHGVAESITGKIKEWKNKFNELKQNYNPLNYIAGAANKGLQGQIQGPARQTTEEGVVSIKLLSNCMMAVVYTTGVLKIWSSQTSYVIAEYNLVRNGLDENHAPVALNLEKIVKAKIDFVKRPLAHTEVDINFDIVVGYAQQCKTSFKLSWSITQLNLQFNISPRMRLTLDDTNENKLDFSDEQRHLHLYTNLKLQDSLEVVEVQYELEPRGNAHLWLVTHSYQNNKSTIQDLKASGQNTIWDKESNQDYEKLFDTSNLPEELQKSYQSPFSQILTEHLIQRLTVRDRFRPATFQYVSTEITQNGTVNAIDVGQLNHFADNNDGHIGLFKLLEESINFEQSNSRIIGFSKAIKHNKYRIVIRPIGISLISEDSQLRTLQNYTNQTCLQLQQELKNNPSLSGIRQIFPLNQEDSDSLLYLLIGSIKYMHLSSLLSFDQTLKSDPSQSIEELIMNIFRESNSLEILKTEVIRVLQGNRELIEKQLTKLIDKLCQYLEINTYQGRNMRQSFVLISKKAHSISMLKKIERGLWHEIKGLYEFIRDLLIAQAYIQLNNPNIGISCNEQAEIESQIEGLKIWMRQLAAVIFVVEQEFSINSLMVSHCENSADIESLLKGIQIQYQGENLSYLTYLIASNEFEQQKKRPSIGLLYNYDEQTSSQDELLSDFLNRFTISIDPQNNMLFPPIARTLHKLRQWPLLNVYLSLLLDTRLPQFQTLPIQIASALSAAQSGGNAHLFAEHINSSVLLYKQVNKLDFKLSDVILESDLQIQRDLENQVKSLTSNRDLQFYLIINQQLQGLDSRYEIFVLLMAIQDTQKLPPSADDSDMLNERYFYASKLIPNGGGLDFMREAILNMNNYEKRKQILGQFLEHLSTCNDDLKYEDYYKFSHSDIDRAIDYIQSRIESELLKEPSAGISNLYQLIRILIALSNIYVRQVETSRFLWSLILKIDNLVQKNIMGPINIYQSLLKLHIFALTNLYIYALTYTDHLFILDDSAELGPSQSKKRDRSAFTTISEKSVDFDQLLSVKGLGLLKDYPPSDLKFYSGPLKRVTLDDIRQSLILAESRLMCSEYFRGSSADDIVNVLTEMREYDLAIELAIASKISLGYPVMMIVREYNQKVDEEAPEQVNIREEEKINRDGTKWVKSIASEPKIETLEQKIVSITSRVSKNELRMIAQGVISQKIKVPEVLEKEIVRSGLLKQLLEFYLCDLNTNVKEAVKLVVKNIPQSIKEIADQDIQLLVLFLETMDDSLNANKEEFKALKDILDSKLMTQRRLREREDLKCSMDFNNDLIDYLGMDSKEFYDALAIENDDARSLNSDIEEIRRDMKKIEELNRLLEDSIPKIKAAVKTYLNGI